MACRKRRLLMGLFLFFISVFGDGLTGKKRVLSTVLGGRLTVQSSVYSPW